MTKQGSMALSIALGAGILYLGAQAMTGRQGLLAYIDLQAQERTLEHRVADLQQQHAALEARAQRLQPGSHFDEDYLGERARVSLAAGDPNEVVFRLDR